MGSVVQAGESLTQSEWNGLRLRAIFDCCKWDPQCGDRAVLGRFPLLLEPATVAQLAAWAERLTEEGLAAEDEIVTRPGLLSRLAIPKRIRGFLRKAEDQRREKHIRVMRFDFHYTRRGWQISEVNADVPGGYVEASGWNELFAQMRSCWGAPQNPARAYAAAIADAAEPESVTALAHATVFSEDRQVMAHLAGEIEKTGRRTVLVSPENIRWNSGTAQIRTAFATCDPAVVVRLTPAEWLCRSGSSQQVEPWFRGSRTPLSNPGRAIILQSKRFPLAWVELRSGLPTWRRLLPHSFCPSEVRRLERDDLVVKPAFGRVGEDVAVRGVTRPQEYEQILRAVRKREFEWIAQDRFEVIPVPTAEGNVYPCVGVYTVNGKMAGLYGRASYKALIDGDALDVAVLVREAQSGGQSC